MQTIDGKKISTRILQEVKQKLASFSSLPKLAIILATDDLPAHTYVSLKRKKANELGIEVDVYNFDNQSSVEDIVSRIKQLNGDHDVSGIMVQLPLHLHLQGSKQTILDAVDEQKDIDGLSSANQGLLVTGNAQPLVSATAMAVLESIAFTQQLEANASGFLDWVTGKKVVIINSSTLVGKPLASFLSNHEATVVLANKHTKSLSELTQQADILITASGQGHLLSSADIKPQAIVIDVTSIKTPDGVIGDVIVDPELTAKAAWLSPVPGGVGPVTIACLLRNLVLAHQRNNAFISPESTTSN